MTTKRGECSRDPGTGTRRGTHAVARSMRTGVEVRVGAKIFRGVPVAAHGKIALARAVGGAHEMGGGAARRGRGWFPERGQEHGGAPGESAVRPETGRSWTRYTS